MVILWVGDQVHLELIDVFNAVFFFSFFLKNKTQKISIIILTKKKNYHYCTLSDHKK
jgi:hypothetical protein